MARIELWNGDICDLEVDAIVNAANMSLWMSTGVSGEIKRAGYDVFLVLEATIGFNKRDGEENDDVADDEAESPRTFETTGKIKLTTQDQKFLRALKITVDEESH